MADALEVSIKLKQHNSNVRRLWGKEYPVKIVPYINLLDGCMKKLQCNVVVAIKSLEKEDISTVMLLAAAYEVLNRSELSQAATSATEKEGNKTETK